MYTLYMHTQLIVWLYTKDVHDTALGRMHVQYTEKSKWSTRYNLHGRVTYAYAPLEKGQMVGGEGLKRANLHADS